MSCSRTLWQVSRLMQGFKRQPFDHQFYQLSHSCSPFTAHHLRHVPHPTCTGSSSTLTCPAISSMSRARWQMDLAWCVHGSGSPLTVMYLSPTVSTCVNKEAEINQSVSLQTTFRNPTIRGIYCRFTPKPSVAAALQSGFLPFTHSTTQNKQNRPEVNI